MDTIRLSIHAMATRFELTLHGGDPVRLRASGEEALREIERLDRQLSFYRPESEITWINARAAEAPVKIEPRLFRLLERCSELDEATDGAFDVAVAPLMRTWGFTSGDGSMADPAEIEKALEISGMRHVHLDPTDFTIRFDREGVQLDLGAIGKGYAIERAIGILRETGVTSGLIHGGTSTIYGLGAQLDGSPWKVGIGDRLSVIGNQSSVIGDRSSEVEELSDCALAVSAVHGKCFRDGDEQFGHVIDPRTGYPVKGSHSAAVIGASPTVCDALSTAMLILGKSGLQLLADKFPGYSGIALSDRR